MKLLNILILFLSFLKVNAQYTITASQKPAIGDSYNYINLDTSNIINGTSGANQIWNFTNLILPITPTVNSIYYSDATAIPNYTWFPGAYMAIIDPDGTFTSYDSDPNNFSLNWIYYSFTQLSTKFQDSYTKYHYPISYGSIFSDSVKRRAYNQHPPNPAYIDNYPTVGINTYTCSGSGTLNLPNGISIPNTLKLNITYYKKIVDGMTNDSVGYQITEYEEYFNTMSKFPILAYYKTLGYTTYPFTSAPTLEYSKNISLNTIAVNSVIDLDKSAVTINIFPHPSHNFFNLQFTSINNLETPVFEIQNYLGQIMEVKTTRIQSEFYHLDVSNYPSGMYLLITKLGKKQIIKKILVD
jgi:hypothetical protein